MVGRARTQNRKRILGFTFNRNLSLQSTKNRKHAMSESQRLFRYYKGGHGLPCCKDKYLPVY